MSFFNANIHPKKIVSFMSVRNNWKPVMTFKKEEDVLDSIAFSVFEVILVQFY